ncbi:MAG: o-succinylbenzoate synthase [Bifidobacteriaceae bacterium]|nr:o-succinylbenzoate synthase [Bifidobacteriaceae bacterium]
MEGVTFVFDIPLTVRFRSIERRRGMVFEGPAGWAEFSPFEEYPPAVAAPWWRAAQEAAQEGFPEPVRQAVPVNITVPALPAPQAEALVRAAVSEPGNSLATAKVKVAEPGQSVAEETDRVAAVRAALGPGGRIRIDANGAWDTDEAVARIRALDKAARGLEYAEQPCAGVAGLAEVRRRVAVPIAADESIRRSGDGLAVKRLAAADIAVLKVQPLGGVRACLALAEALELPVVVSSAVETSVGLAMGVALAAALPRLDYACGLGTLPLLAGDVVAEGLLVSDAVLPVRPAIPSPALLERWAAPPPVRAAWLERRDVVARLVDKAGAL